MKSKRLFLLLALVAGISFTGCKKESVREGRKDASSELLAYIKSLGYNESQIQDLGSEYLVDGDMLFPKNMNIGSSSKNSEKISQYGTGHYVSSTNLILIKVDPSMSGYISEIQSAVNQWNSIPNLGLSFGIYDGINGVPNVTITNANLGLGGCGAAYVPYNGVPGSLIRINVSEIQFNSFDQRQRTITHEIGHIIGLRHTNWKSRNEPKNGFDDIGTPAGAVHLPGTPTGNEYGSLMNGGECGTGATTLSEYDKIAVQYLYTYMDQIGLPESLKPAARISAGGVDTLNHTVIHPRTSPFLLIGQNIYSPNGEYRLRLQSDGNLVLSKMSTGTVLWATNVPYAKYAFFQTDANVVMTGSDWSNVLWSAGFGGPANSALNAFVSLQNNGDLVVYYPMPFSSYSLNTWVLGKTETADGVVSSHFGSLAY